VATGAEGAVPPLSDAEKTKREREAEIFARGQQRGQESVVAAVTAGTQLALNSEVQWLRQRVEYLQDRLSGLMDRQQKCLEDLTAPQPEEPSALGEALSAIAPVLVERLLGRPLETGRDPFPPQAVKAEQRVRAVQGDPERIGPHGRGCQCPRPEQVVRVEGLLRRHAPGFPPVAASASVQRLEPNPTLTHTRSTGTAECRNVRLLTPGGGSQEYAFKPQAPVTPPQAPKQGKAKAKKKKRSAKAHG